MKRAVIIGVLLLAGVALGWLWLRAGASAAAPDVAAQTRSRADNIPVDERGESVFSDRCAACHAQDVRLVGPPLTELAAEYPGNPDAIVEWAKNPKKRRADYPDMPAVLASDDDLRAAARYILQVGKKP